MGWVGVVNRDVGGLFPSVGVNVDAFDGSWAGAVAPTRVGPLKDFCAGCFKSFGETVRGKRPPGL